MRLLYDTESKVERCPLSVRKMAPHRRMDNEEFKRRLSEVAEWRVPATLTGTKDGDAKAKRTKRGRPTNEELYQNEHEEIFLELHNGTNPTFPPQLLKLKKCATNCDDCGKQCPNGREKEKKLYQTGNKKNWRERCLTCGMTKNPYTGEFDLDTIKASQVWNAFVRDIKPKAKKQIKEPVVEQHRDKTVIESDTGTITFYHEKNTDA